LKRMTAADFHGEIIRHSGQASEARQCQGCRRAGTGKAMIKEASKLGIDDYKVTTKGRKMTIVM
jgi:hypothetical protein